MEATAIGSFRAWSRMVVFTSLGVLEDDVTTFNLRIGQWFQPGTILSPRRYLAMSGEICGCLGAECKREVMLLASSG